jgi:hypothetical protein
MPVFGEKNLVEAISAKWSHNHESKSQNHERDSNSAVFGSFSGNFTL